MISKDFLSSGEPSKAERDCTSLGVLFHQYPELILPESMLLETVMRSLKCSSFPQDSSAGVGIHDPCSKTTPDVRERLSSFEGVRMLRQESPPVTDTSPGSVVNSFLQPQKIYIAGLL